MSSFYDRTQTIITWAKTEKVAPSELSTILRRRLAQSREHMEWAAKRNKEARKLLDKIESEVGTLQAYSEPLFQNNGISPFNTFFKLSEQILDTISSLSSDELYGDYFDVESLRQIFETLHNYGHSLGRLGARISDNPYPFNRRTVSDSDKWIREQVSSGRYPDVPELRV